MIIDDEQFSIDAILKYINLHSRLEVINIFLDPLDALNNVSLTEHIDIIFMDIDMPNLTGIELAKALRSRTAKLIFTTSHSQYAFDAYEVDGDAFLLKPYTFAKFSTTINRLFPVDERTTNAILKISDHFLVKNKEENLRIINLAFDDVIAFESSNNYVKIHTRDDRQITAYLTIKEVLDIVSSRKEFLQFHRAFIISTKHINYIEGNSIRLTNKLAFNIGERYKNTFNAFLSEQLLKTTRK
ncbi:LytR/AlgR family response regulator transcription factor [Mucilaginibacter terrae]|uniref:LytR/AlgR family response regulator transcription factor n=1 Tax=Mucilaginibacter terrae TaxID=1955052 RepID=UPI00289BD7F2|nr:LytTR family DNA-binding domain-containing protein [Mucilaginibacter terrae]